LSTYRWDTMYNVEPVATCPDMNGGVKIAQRWCRGSKNSKCQKNCLGLKNLNTFFLNEFKFHRHK
jgi:hypothetical protein